VPFQFSGTRIRYGAPFILPAKSACGLLAEALFGSEPIKNKIKKNPIKSIFFDIFFSCAESF
jgi:hypothetical protein